MIFESLHGRVHVNGEGYDDVETDDDTKVVKYDEEVAIPQVTALDVNTHSYDYVPIIYHYQDKESDIRGHQIVKVDEIVIVWYGLVMENLS